MRIINRQANERKWARRRFARSRENHQYIVDSVLLRFCTHTYTETFTPEEKCAVRFRVLVAILAAAGMLDFRPDTAYLLHECLAYVFEQSSAVGKSVHEFEIFQTHAHMQT